MIIYLKVTKRYKKGRIHAKATYFRNIFIVSFPRNMFLPEMLPIYHIEGYYKDINCSLVEAKQTQPLDSLEPSLSGLLSLDRLFGPAHLAWG